MAPDKIHLTETALKTFESSATPADYRRGLSPGVLDVSSLEPACDGDNVEALFKGGAVEAVGRLTPLDWDSDFFGTAAGRLEGLYFDAGAASPFALRSAMVKRLVEKADNRKIRFLNCRISAADTYLAQALEEQEFRLCDILNIYTVELSGGAGQGSGSRDEALKILDRCIATMNFGRVHQDPMIEPSVATKFYRETTAWVLSKDCHVTIARKDGRSVGLAIGVVDGDMSRALGRRYGFLWLIAVMPEYGGRGIGGELLNAFMGEFSASCDLLEIGTQVSNVAANRLYQNTGCRLATQALTFHRWSWGKAR